MKQQRLKANDFFTAIIICLLVIIGTFIENDWSFRNGIDSPLSWVFNFLYETGPTLGKHIVFPHGPLAFLMYPLPENIGLTILIISILKALLVLNLFWLFTDIPRNTRWLVSFFIAYFISIISGINHLIIANVILLYSNYLISEQRDFQRTYKYIAFLLVAFAFYIRLYVTVITCTISLSFLLINLVKSKDYKRFIVDGVVIIGMVYIVWIAVFNSFTGFLNYLFGIFQLTMDNSSAASYYPYNNWWVLSLFLLILTSISIIKWEKKSNFYWPLIGISMFAAWKHGMARQEILHMKGFLIFIIICLTIYIAIRRKQVLLFLILSVFSIFLFLINLRNVDNYSSPQYELSRINNFTEFVFDFKSLKKQSESRTTKNISISKLQDSTLKNIGDSKVDVYPWDYSIIPANGFTWQPRVVINSYASYTSWLDRMNADHFSSELAPEFLIWHFDKRTKDVNGSNYNSIDNRYLLNDEPQTLIKLLSNYDYWDTDGKFVLYKRREAPLIPTSEIIDSYISEWGKWINVPESQNSALRVKLTAKKGIIQNIKSFIFKDEQFWIYLKLNDGSIHKYRIVPKNASDGLWINPYVYNLGKAYEVDQVLFKGSNQRILSKHITIDWEQIKFHHERDRIEKFFQIESSNQDSTHLSIKNDFESHDKKPWSSLSKNQISDKSFEGLQSHLVSANSFSSTFDLALDSLLYGNYRISTECWINDPGFKSSNDVLLVLSIDDNLNNIVWKGLHVDGQLIDKHQWNHIYNYINYYHNSPKCTLKAYIYNTSDRDILMDNFKVMINFEE